MCGIAAIFSYAADARPIGRRSLQDMAASMARRGPDGAGEWASSEGRTGLAHRRLAIIDPGDGGAQPMASGTGRSWISFNGEIYNYRELRRELEQQGCRFKSNSDTEVLLHLYERDGADMLPRLRGMFGLILWDAERCRMLIARDPMGIKPLYYADDGRRISIASQVKALIAGEAEAGSLSPAGCVSFFLLGSVADPFTIYRGIRALPAGHFMWIDQAGPSSPRPFFSIRDILAEAEDTRHDIAPDERNEILREALEDAVAAHMVADVPVGVFLSAGLDSSSIAALAGRFSATAPQTITLGFREYAGTDGDEVPLAGEIARAFATRHHAKWIGRADFEKCLDAILAAMDQPTIDGVNTYFVSAAAAERGLKVALSGLGGDELFGGYPSYREIPRLTRLLAPLRSLPAMGRTFRIVTSGLIGDRLSPKYAGILEYGTRVEDAYLLRRALFMPWELPEILGPEFVKEGWADLKPRLSLRDTFAGLRRDRARIAALEMCWYMRHQLLRDADWAGMAHSLEIRTPFVDAELLRRLAPLLVADLPPTKQDMARATPLGALNAVVGRPKTGFTVPIHDWLSESADDGYGGRGLRGWSKLVFDRLAAGFTLRGSLERSQGRHSAEHFRTSNDVRPGALPAPVLRSHSR